MNIHKANLINALVLMGVSVVRFLQDGKGNVVLLTPVVVSVVLLALSNGVYYGIRSQVKAVLTITVTMLLLCLSFLVTDLHAKGTWSVICMAASCFISAAYLSKHLLVPQSRR
jgi:hypothetical protein